MAWTAQVRVPSGLAASTTSRAKRVLVTLLAGTALATSLSSCAFAGRLLATADAAALIRDVANALPDREAHPDRSVEGAGPQAVVTGTGGSGLRLNDRPGADRLDVFPDGTEVTVLCRSVGPTVAGPDGESSAWSLVEAPDGGTGYMSNAYLRPDADNGNVPACD